MRVYADGICAVELALKLRPSSERMGFMKGAKEACNLWHGMAT